jgi:hypothetical protein
MKDMPKFDAGYIFAPYVPLIITKTIPKITFRLLWEEHVAKNSPLSPILVYNNWIKYTI